MDHDVMARHLNRLVRAEPDIMQAVAFLKGMQTAGGKLTAPPEYPFSFSDGERAELRDVLAGLVDPLSKALDEKLNAFDGRLKTLETSRGLTVGDLEGRMEAMLTWFEANQAGLEALIAPGGPDKTPKEAIPGAADASGASAGAGGANAPGGTAQVSSGS